jgi:hypothetical protein
LERAHYVSTRRVSYSLVVGDVALSCGELTHPGDAREGNAQDCGRFASSLEAISGAITRGTDYDSMHGTLKVDCGLVVFTIENAKGDRMVMELTNEQSAGVAKLLADEAGAFQSGILP